MSYAHATKQVKQININTRCYIIIKFVTLIDTQSNKHDWRKETDSRRQVTFKGS